MGDDSRVVLYDAGMSMWAARVWWMLRAFGFDHAAILNGGCQKKWTAESRPIESGMAPTLSPRGSLRAHNPRGIADWKEVRSAIGSPGAAREDALSADADTLGKVTFRVTRPGQHPRQRQRAGERAHRPIAAI